MKYRSSNSFEYEFKDILRLIEEVDHLFNPPLSDRVDLKSYAKKIDSLSSLELAYTDEAELVGMIAYYNNDYETQRAYITFLGVKQSYHKKGIASKLLAMCIRRCRETDMKEIKVRTEKYNQAAIKLYEGKGFILDGNSSSDDNWESIFLKKNLSKI